MPANKHPEDIKAEVRKTGITLAELARQCSLDESTTRAALRRPQPSGNRAIAKRLNVALHELWPEWFDDQGNRIPSNKKHSSEPAGRDSQKGGAR